jgi:hypothetical protein
MIVMLLFMMKYFMNRNEKLKYIEEIFKVCKTDSILIINKKGQFERINCPFLVRVIISVPPLIEGEVESVTAVKLSIELIDVYIIKGSNNISHLKICELSNLFILIV